jgi:ABC-type bacteriocin/lantibiotic exporter with double-glycine peptidase domain
VTESAALRHLEPGQRLRVAPEQIVNIVSGGVNAAAVLFQGNLPDGPGLHLATLGPGDLALGLPTDGLTIELSVLMPTTVITGDLLVGLAVPSLDRWLRDVERVDGYTPFTSPRAVFAGQATIRAGEVVAAPRESVVWVGEREGWTVLSDTNPRAWLAEMEVEISTTSGLRTSGLLEVTLRDWNAATAARLARLVAREPGRRAGNVAAASIAVAEAAAAARAAVSGLAAGLIGQTRTSTTEAVARVVRLSNSAVLSEASDRLETARQAAGQAGFGARVVALNQPLDGEKGPPLLLGMESDAAPPSIGAALTGTTGYLINGVSQRALLRRTGMRLAARAVALTQPLSERLIAALDRPARLFAAVLAASPIDAAVALLWGIGAILLSIAMPMAVNLLFTSIWPRADVSGHWLVIAALMAITFTGVGFESARSLRARRLAMQFGWILENGLWLRLVRARPRSSVSGGGDTLERILTASQLNRLLGSQPMKFATDLGLLAIGIAQMIYYGGQLAWIGAAASVLIVLFCIALLPAATKAWTETEELSGKQAALLAQAIAAVTKIKATASENFILARWAALADRRRGSLRRAERMATLVALATAGIGGLATAAVFVMAGFALGLGNAEAGLLATTPEPTVTTITLGAFLAFQVSLGQTISAATSASEMTTLWPTLAASGARITPVASLPPETVGPRTTPPALEGAITISQLTHRYPGSDAPSLDHIELEIAPREYVAIVGASGSGKSTLLRIILGLEQPDQGAVYFDGLDAKQLDPAPLRRQIGYVGQDSRLSPGTILDNIFDGRDAELAAAWEAAHLAGLARDIEVMPMGMQTLVGEAGQNISGGQRQRILIARAVLSRPRILIFDEATSALDNRSQSTVQRGLAELPVTRVVVAHRFSTIRQVNRVFVLSKGRLVESGPPDELLRQGGAFARLAGRQLLQAVQPGLAQGNA